ncbi:MAG: hypothetical protein O3A49_04430 [Candidatus Marinimicrobia bacterium]|jgi:hypothetical protein|nr:hypothetical protein [Candidatus Neomarinimicrobiota bacterium]
METKFCLRLIKETYIDAKDYEEANQIAEMMVVRESGHTLFGNLVTVTTEIEQL